MGREPIAETSDQSGYKSQNRFVDWFDYTAVVCGGGLASCSGALYGNGYAACIGMGVECDGSAKRTTCWKELCSKHTWCHRRRFLCRLFVDTKSKYALYNFICCSALFDRSRRSLSTQTRECGSRRLP